MASDLSPQRTGRPDSGSFLNFEGVDAGPAECLSFGMILECQINTAGHWGPLGIDEALESKREGMRCPACNGPVRPHKEYNNGVAAHFEHHVAHKGCPLIKRTFEEPASPHPDALK
jgi:hypothetical protein